MSDPEVEFVKELQAWGLAVAHWRAGRDQTMDGLRFRASLFELTPRVDKAWEAIDLAQLHPGTAAALDALWKMYRLTQRQYGLYFPIGEMFDATQPGALASDPYYVDFLKFRDLIGETAKLLGIGVTPTPAKVKTGSGTSMLKWLGYGGRYPGKLTELEKRGAIRVERIGGTEKRPVLRVTITDPSRLENPLQE